MISYSLSPLSWRLTFYVQKVEYCNFLINYMYEASHIAYTKIANLEGEFIDLNVLSKHQMQIVPSWSYKDNYPSLMYEWHHNNILIFVIFLWIFIMHGYNVDHIRSTMSSICMT